MLKHTISLFVLVLLAAGCNSLGDLAPRSTPYPARSCAAEPALLDATFCADPTNMQAARVVRIVDGDTIRLIVGGREEPVRFYGIDTPERGEACFDAAKARTRALAGNEVRLLQDARNRDRNGRLLRYVFTPEGLSIDASLVADGLARAWTADGARRDGLMRLERDARTRKAGCLWSL